MARACGIAAEEALGDALCDISCHARAAVVDIVFAEYGVEVPTAPIVVSADDHGSLELQLFFTRS